MPSAMGLRMTFLPKSVQSLRRCVVTGLAAGVLALLSGMQTAGAQLNEAMQPTATRADLTTLAARLERGSEADRSKAAAVRARLREGDFRPGDRIALVIEGNVSQSDTVPVTAGPKITLTDVGEISLNGVLRSELETYLKTQLNKYVRDARVRATGLVRVSVLGPVGRPGFFFMPPDIPLTEAIMRAGGPAGSADLSRSVIRRGTDELYDSRNTQSAINEGLTLDQLSLRSGDEIVVGTQSTRSWSSVVPIISVATSLILALTYGFARR